MTGRRASASELVLLVLLWRWDHLPPSYTREPDPSLKIIISVPVIFFKNVFMELYIFSPLSSVPLLFCSFLTSHSGLGFSSLYFCLEI